MSGFGFRRDEEDIGVGPQHYNNYNEDKVNRRIEFRYTMKSLNQTFINACQDEVTRAPDCVLVPLIQNYLLYLRDTLTKLNEDPSDMDVNSFTNIGKFYDSISKKLHGISHRVDKPVFNNNNKEMPPLKRRAETPNVGLSNVPSLSSTSLSGAFSTRLSPSEGKRMIFTVPKTSEDSVPTDRNITSGFSGFKSPSTSAQPTSSPNYFSDNSRQTFNTGFMGSAPSKSPSFNLPTGGKMSMMSPQLNSNSVFKKSPSVLNSVGEGSSSNFSNSRMSNTMSSNSPTMLNKSSPVQSSISSAVFPTQNAFGLSSNYTNGISPSLAPMLPKAVGFDMGGSKPFASSPPGTGLAFSTQQQPSSAVKPLTGFSFSPAANFSTPNTQTAVNSKDSDDEDAEPPKNEFTPVVESDSLYNIKCKVFYMIGGSFKDKGVGQLYVKKLDTGKYQLVVRADNTLGTVILNLLLSKSLPLNKKSAKDIITVDLQGNKGEPATVLIRVKDESSATELLNKLTQFKSSSS